MFIQVLREVGTAKEYLNWLIEESGVSTDVVEEGTTFADVIADKAAAGEVGLFGGGGDAPAETPKETSYQPSHRTDVGSTVLLSGTVDSTLLNILNNNFFGDDPVPNFEFGKIRALVEDVAAAKKKAISRDARYGGLLDKLVIEPISTPLPSKEELAGVSSWIVQLSSEDASTMLPQIAELAKDSAELNNVVVMVAGTSSNTVAGWDAVVEASADGESFKCTLLAVGELTDGGKEGGFYHVGQLAEDAMMSSDTQPKLSRKKAYQLLGYALALDSTANQALTAYEYPSSVIEAIATPYAEGDFVVRDDDGNELVDEFHDVKMQSRVIQAMREAGFTQPMELDLLVSKGLAAYKEYVANPPDKENAFTSELATKNAARDEQDKKIMAILEEQSAKSNAEKAAEASKKKAIEVEGIAKEWAIKEYGLRMLGGDLDDSTSEKDFMVSAWDEALTAAGETYDRINSEEYIEQMSRMDKGKVSSENKLFWDGMPPMLRKKREMMVKKVKKQYMDLLSEEDLERIILSD